MADIKWIKLMTDIFDDEKILMIECLPSADSIIVIWFKLLCLSGKMNNDGVFMMNHRIPYTEEMFSAIFRRDVNTVRMALSVFEQYGMIEIVENVVTIPNWNKHQTLDSYEKKKERDRIYQQERRQKQKALIMSDDCQTIKSSYVAISEREEEKEKERELEDTNRAAAATFSNVIDLFHSICVSFPKVVKVSEARKKAIKARLNAGYTMEDFEAVFKKAEASYFLKGGNDRNWSADFDWLIKDANMAKVLDGKYDGSQGQRITKKQSVDNLSSFYDMAAEWANQEGGEA